MHEHTLQLFRRILNSCHKNMWGKGEVLFFMISMFQSFSGIVIRAGRIRQKFYFLT